jgi:hypothetical protein
LKRDSATTPVIPKINPKNYIQCGIYPDLMQTNIVMNSIYDCINAKIDPIGFPVAIAQFAKKQPIQSNKLPKNPVIQKLQFIGF